MSALRYNTDKPSYRYLYTLGSSLRPLIYTYPEQFADLCAVFDQGAVKYAPFNYLKGGKPDSEYLDSFCRHYVAAYGDTYDKDTGCKHMAHALWNLLALGHLNHPPLAAPVRTQESTTSQLIADLVSGPFDGEVLGSLIHNILLEFPYGPAINPDFDQKAFEASYVRRQQ